MVRGSLPRVPAHPVLCLFAAAWCLLDSKGYTPHLSQLSPVNQVSDWLPTIVGALTGTAGAPAAGGEPSRFPLDGINHWPAIIAAGHPGERTEILLELDLYTSATKLPGFPDFGGDQHGDRTQTAYAALRLGEMKLLLGNPGGGYANAWYCTGPPCPYDPSVSQDPFNASHNIPLLTAATVLLYNLTADPGEHHNVAAQHPAIVATMRAKLAAYNRSATSSAQQGLPNDARGNPNSRTDGHNGTIFPWEQLKQDNTRL